MEHPLVPKNVRCCSPTSYAEEVERGEGGASGEQINAQT